ncbi:DDE-type integrase/transposase/recombinase, partial [Streptomyces sp. NPDC001719]
LRMANATRGGDVTGVIFHSDRGSEYVSRRFKRACRRLGVTQSMGRVGSCFDSSSPNPPWQTAQDQPETPLDIHRGINAVSTEARLRIATWITGFYNTRRLHSVCAYRSPIDYEHDHRTDSDLGLAA